MARQEGRESVTPTIKNKILEFWKDKIEKHMDFFYEIGFCDEKIEIILEATIEKDGKKGTCMACGKKAKLEVCHIIPFSQGGSCELRNLFLMCKECHLESPDFKKEKYFFKWVADKKSYFSSRIKMAHEATFENFSFLKNKLKKMNENELKDFIEKARCDSEVFKRVFEEELDNATLHKGSYSDSTWKAVMVETGNEFLKRMI